MAMESLYCRPVGAEEIFAWRMGPGAGRPFRPGIEALFKVCQLLSTHPRSQETTSTSIPIPIPTPTWNHPMYDLNNLQRFSEEAPGQGNQR